MNRFRTPALENVIDLAAGAGTSGEAGEPSGEATEPRTLTFPVLVPIDLTDTHGIEITLPRLQEMANAYDPAVETASLNLDHNWGGPSLGWCQRLWLQDGALWVHYTDLDPATVELIRSKRYTRRSAEIALNHPTTGGWYFTGCALLGNARPAVAGLPPVTLTATPNAEAELTTLRAQAAEATQLLTSILRQKAELDADRRLAELGTRLTPAMAKLAKPLLVELLATRQPLTVKLQLDPTQPAADVAIAEHLLQILAAAPTVEALTAGRLADDVPGARATTLSLSPEREAELQQKYRFTTSWGFQS